MLGPLIVLITEAVLVKVFLDAYRSKILAEELSLQK